MPYLFMAITMVSMVATQILLRKGMLQVGSLSEAGGLFHFFLKAIINPYIIIAIFTTALAAGSWLIATSKAEISKIYPFMGLTFALVAILSWPILGESLNGWRWLGIGLITAGVFLVTGIK
jgi:uncharacterized membrane protein